MENDTNKMGNPESVPYIVFESEIARQERHIKRLTIALIMAIVACVAIFAGHIWYINQYDFESYDQDGEGVNIIGNLNGVDYNGSALKTANQEEQVIGERENDT